jgi:hypothetical protein
MRLDACVLALALGGCHLLSGDARPFRVPTPAGFVELPDQQPAYDYRATSADGVVLAVTSIKHVPRGDLTFWTRALRNRMHLSNGYALLGEREVTCATGLRGHVLELGHDEGGRPHRYALALFVTAERIFVIESGGERTLFDRARPALDAFLATFTPR